MIAVQPDADLGARARLYRQWSAIIRGGDKHLAPPNVASTYPGAPDGFCVQCWLNPGRYGHQDCHADPLEVLRVDLAVTDGLGRQLPARELVAFADLVAATRTSSSRQ